MDNHLRICRISRTYPRDISPGSGLVAFNLARLIPGETLYITKRFQGRYIEPPSNVRLVIIPYWELGKVIGSVWFLLRAAPIIIRFRPHIIHIHTVLPVLFGVFTKAVLKIPVVMTFHGTDFFWFRKIRLLRWLVDHTVDIVFCVSHRMMDEARSLLRRTKAAFVPNGVDLKLFCNHGRFRQKQIVAVGALKWQKGYEYLLQAMKILKLQQPDLKLVIAGRGPLEERLRSSVSSMGLKDNVHFLGAVSHNKVAELLNTSRVFAMASVFEGFPKALLEAMACGTPVVATDVGECARAVDGAGYVVPPESPKDLAKAILNLMTDEDEWQRCSRQAQERVQEYTWDGVARRTKAVYKELL